MLTSGGKLHSICESPNLILLSVMGNNLAPHITVVSAAYSLDTEVLRAVEVPRRRVWRGRYRHHDILVIRARRDRGTIDQLVKIRGWRV